jgi:hypothetical protein
MKNAFLSATMVLVACGGGSAASSAEPATPSSSETAGQSAEAPAPANACEELATTCHGHDEGNTLVTQCHLLGHDSDAAACSARYTECMTACKQAAAEHAHAE